MLCVCKYRARTGDRQKKSPLESGLNSNLLEENRGDVFMMLRRTNYV
jgi:hypothetical protein